MHYVGLIEIYCQVLRYIDLVDHDTVRPFINIPHPTVNSSSECNQNLIDIGGMLFVRHTVSIQFIRNNLSFDNEKMGECMHYLSVYGDRDKVTI